MTMYLILWNILSNYTQMSIMSWLFLIELDKVETKKKKDEVKHSKSQFKLHIHDINPPIFTLKQTLISYNHTVQISEN